MSTPLDKWLDEVKSELEKHQVNKLSVSGYGHVPTDLKKAVRIIEELVDDADKWYALKWVNKIASMSDEEVWK